MHRDTFEYYKDLLEIGETYYIHYFNRWVAQCKTRNHPMALRPDGLTEYIGTLIDITEDRLKFDYKKELHYTCLVTIQKLKFTPKPKNK